MCIKSINKPMGSSLAVGTQKHQSLSPPPCVQAFHVYHFLFHSFLHVATYHKPHLKKEKDSQDLFKAWRDSNIVVLDCKTVD